MSKDNNYIPITTAVGGIGGAIYGFRHPSEKSIARIEKLEPKITETMKEFRDCFDILTAGQSVREGNLALNEYQEVNDLRTLFHKAFEKEQQVIDVSNTPIEERKITFKEAIKEANEIRNKVWVKLITLNSELKEKMVKFGIFDLEKFNQVRNSCKTKFIATLKELSKGAAKTAAIGTAIGLGLGYYFNKISNNKKAQERADFE